jgi:hypothetical protein
VRYDDRTEKGEKQYLCDEPQTAVFFVSTKRFHVAKYLEGVIFFVGNHPDGDQNLNLSSDRHGFDSYPDVSPHHRFCKKYACRENV